MIYKTIYRKYKENIDLNAHKVMVQKVVEYLGYRIIKYIVFKIILKI